MQTKTTGDRQARGECIERIGRTDEQRLNNRLASMWLGDSANVKRRAWNEALALLN